MLDLDAADEFTVPPEMLDLDEIVPVQPASQVHRDTDGNEAGPSTPAEDGTSPPRDDTTHQLPLG